MAGTVAAARGVGRRLSSRLAGEARRGSGVFVNTSRNVQLYGLPALARSTPPVQPFRLDGFQGSPGVVPDASIGSTAEDGEGIQPAP